MFPFRELHLQAPLGMPQGPWSALNTQTDRLKTSSETHSVFGQVDFCILQFLQMSEKFFFFSSCAFLIVLGIQIQAQTRSRTLVRRLHSVNHGDVREATYLNHLEANFLGTQKGMERRHSGERNCHGGLRVPWLEQMQWLLTLYRTWQYFTAPPPKKTIVKADN